jgi:15-cis-phytoene synthase
MSAALLAECTSEARAALVALYAALQQQGMGTPSSADGQLIRPLLSLAGAKALGIEQDARFWAAAAAVQLAHEASLLHDDVIDGAALRRSAPTLVAERGVAVALVEGDHLLTTSYRLAATCGAATCAAFAHAVERTVAGEKLQGRATGMVLDEASYRRIIAGKSGELLGFALAAGAYVTEHPAASSLYVLGRRVGELYQMLDDLLDYCPDADTGKPPLADFGARRWTWPLLELGAVDYGESATAVAERLATCDAAGSSPLRRCVARFEREVDVVRAALAVHMPCDVVVTALVCGWRERARAAAAAVERAAELRTTRTELEARVPDDVQLHAFFRANSHTFSFAARAFPRAFRDRVADVYAFCRVTDDLVDDAGATDAERAGDDRMRRLDLWESLSLQAHRGEPTGIALLDRVLGDAAAAGVPFRCVAELLAGMRMDLRGQRYATLPELRVYTYRVAGVIGEWLTIMAGVHDADVLERAADLGHALQLTNILRDAGEDLRAGRLYLPADLMAESGVDEAMLHEMQAGAPVTEAYRSLLERLMQCADEHYARALTATDALPAWYRYAVRMAAHVYRGIHDEIRSAGHDNLRRRARTGALRKLQLGWRGLTSHHVSARPSAARERAIVAARPVRATRTALVALLLAGATVPAARVTAQEPKVGEQVADAVARATADPSDADARIDLVRAVFFAAVDDERAVRRGHEAIAVVRRYMPAAAARHEALLLGYEGAFTALEAKHGIWPHARLRAVRRGLARLDAAVAAAPHHLEIRYLRMVTSFHLPSLFGRSEAAREDLHVIEQLLPGSAAHYPPALFRVMAEFVIEHGDRAVAAELRGMLDPPAGTGT